MQHAACKPTTCNTQRQAHDDKRHCGDSPLGMTGGRAADSDWSVPHDGASRWQCWWRRPVTDHAFGRATWTTPCVDARECATASWCGCARGKSARVHACMRVRIYLGCLKCGGDKCESTNSAEKKRTPYNTHTTGDANMPRAHVATGQDRGRHNRTCVAKREHEKRA